MAKRNRDKRRNKIDPSVRYNQKREELISKREKKFEKLDKKVEKKKQKGKYVDFVNKEGEKRRKITEDYQDSLTDAREKKEDLIKANKERDKGKKKIVTTVKAPVSTTNPNINTPQSKVTTVDGKVVPEKKQKKQKVGIVPITGIDAVDNRSKVQLGDAIKDEAAKKVDLGESTLKEYKASFNDSKAVEQVKEKEKEEAEKKSKIPGDGSTISGVVSGGAPPASFSQVGTKQQVEQTVKDKNKEDAVNRGDRTALDNLAEQAAVEKLGVQDYYPQAARSVGVGTFTGEIIGSQTIYSGAGVLAPMGLYDARKRALAKAAQTKQKAINDFLTLKDTAKAYNMEYKDRAYDALYGILKDHNFSVSSVMRDPKAMKEVQRWKGLGKELLFVEEEAKAVMENISEEGKYVPPNVQKLVKEIYYGLQDKDKVFSGDVKLTPKIAEMKTYLSLIKKSEDLAKEYKATLSERPLTEQEIASGEIKGDEQFEKEKADFMKRVNKGELDRNQDGYITGVLKYFGGNVNELFQSYIDSGEYSDDQLEDAKKIFVNLMPELTELTVKDYAKKVSDLDMQKFRFEKYKYEDEKKTKIGFFEISTKQMGAASNALTSYLADGTPKTAEQVKSNIANVYAQTGATVSSGQQIPGKDTDDTRNTLYAVNQVSFEQPIQLSATSKPTTTVSVDGKIMTVGMRQLLAFADQGKTVKTLDGVSYQKENFDDVRFAMAGRKDVAVSLTPTQVNTSLSYFNPNTKEWNQLNEGNANEYAASQIKAPVRDFTGTITASRLFSETGVALSQTASDAFGLRETKKKVKRTVTLLGSWTGAPQVAGEKTDKRDTQLLFNPRVDQVTQSTESVSVNKSSN